MTNLFDVARLAGVSIATVSRVLNESGTVADRTRKKVLAAVDTLQYRQNQVARNLRTGRGSTVALVTGDIEQGVYAKLAKVVQGDLELLGLDLMLFNIAHQEDRLHQLLQRANVMGLRGVLLATPHFLDFRPLLPELKSLMDAGLKIISISHRLESFGIPVVLHDDAAGAAAAVRYLHGNGRRNIAFLGRIKASAVGTVRYEGYKAGLKEVGLPLHESLVWEIAQRYRADAGYAEVSQQLATTPSVDAVLAASDELALGGMAAVLDSGRRVPEDIGFIGFGGVQWARYVRPSLTTISLDAEGMSAAIATLFQDESEAEVSAALNLIPPSLVVGDSA